MSLSISVAKYFGRHLILAIKESRYIYLAILNSPYAESLNGTRYLGWDPPRLVDHQWFQSYSTYLQLGETEFSGISETIIYVSLFLCRLLLEMLAWNKMNTHQTDKEYIKQDFHFEDRTWTVE